MKNFEVFHRTWWRDNPSWPNGREPGVGERHFIAWAEDETEARAIAREWNEAHDPGPLSDKAEFDEA